MIRKLTGRVVDAGPAFVVVDVNGVGYKVATSQAGTNFATESDVSLWTYLAVRETALDLYGFTTRDELEIFELLLTLPKIGPKSALQVLSQADIELLKKAVAQQDAVYLSKMSGIGKKTAEKIVSELQDKFEDLASYQTDPSQTDTQSQHISDIIDALITLGYPQKDARDAVQKLTQENPESLANSNTAITAALKMLGS